MLNKGKVLCLNDIQPIVVNVEIAAILGLKESVILQQIHYWLMINREANKNHIDGKYWTYNTFSEWHKQFPFLSRNTMIRKFDALEKMGIVISRNYNENNHDQTKWYTIDYDKLHDILNSKVKEGEEAGHPETSEDGNVQNGKMGEIGEDKWVNAFTQNGKLHLPKMGKSYTETTTDTKEREKQINFLNEWKKKTLEELQPLHSLNDNEIVEARKEFITSGEIKDIFFSSIDKVDKAFELWCSRYHSVKGRYARKSSSDSANKEPKAPKVNSNEWVNEIINEKPEPQRAIYKEIQNKLGDSEFIKAAIAITEIEITPDRIVFKGRPGVHNHQTMYKYSDAIVDVLKAFKPQSSIEFLGALVKAKSGSA